MTNSIFWNRIQHIIDEDFSSDGLAILEYYAEQFIERKLVYKRFSSCEQHGCTAGGVTNVIATILAGANDGTNPTHSFAGDFKRECQFAKTQEQIIEHWARKTNCWIDNSDWVLTQRLGEQIAEGGEAHVYQQGNNLIKSIGLDYYIQPILALDRIALHNAYFPETSLSVIGFGRDSNGNFQVIVEQNFIQGKKMTNEEIFDFAVSMGFKCINPKNWTYATPEIYLSDLHDENVIRSKEGNIFVVDCDIRINTPELRCAGVRQLTREIQLLNSSYKCNF